MPAVHSPSSGGFWFDPQESGPENRARPTDVAPETSVRSSYGGTPGYGPPTGGAPDYGPPAAAGPGYGPPPSSAPGYGAADSPPGYRPAAGDPHYGQAEHGGEPGYGPPYGEPRYGPTHGESGYGPPDQPGRYGPPDYAAPNYDPPDYAAPDYGAPGRSASGYGPPGAGELGRHPGYDQPGSPAGAPAAPGTTGLAAPRTAAPGAPRTPPSRAGRNLPMAITVGVTLGGLVIGSLYFWRPAFVVLATAAILLGIWEMVRAVEPVEARPPLAPLLVGGAAIMILAWFAGIEAMVLGLVLTVLAVLVWRLSDGPVGYQRDFTAATLIAAYVPFLAGFAILLAQPDDGAFRVTIMIASVVLSDVGGYATGVFLGRHPMAPSVSPKKSWEGFAGSVVASATGAAIMLYLMLGVPWWQGAIYGVAAACAATLGDLSESLMKRDLGIKDMGQLLPGHGGLMDRLDSLLLAAPVGYLLLLTFAPPAG
ncbi:MAG: phosphatidate cytidylyltransferase [Micromonosporaceae bacterium]